MELEILDGKFLAVAGESAKSAKIFPLQNFALYGKSSYALSLTKRGYCI